MSVGSGKATGGGGSVFRAFGAVAWMAAVLAIIGLALAVLVVVRRRLLSRNDADGLGFSLDDLRRQRDEGLLTAAEFDAIRRQVIASMTEAPRSTKGASADKMVQLTRVS